MIAIASPQWQRANQHYLFTAIRRVQVLLQCHLAPNDDGSKAITECERQLEAIATDWADLTSPSALEHLCQRFQLSSFERNVVLLCAGVELEPQLKLLCTQAQPDLKHGAPTFGLAGQLFEHCHWEAFTPGAPLRRWQLLEVGAGSLLMALPLRISEMVLHYLMGIRQLDERLMGVIEPLESTSILTPSQQDLANKIALLWESSPADKILPVVQLCGEEGITKQAIAVQACRQLQMTPYRLSGHALPTATSDLYQLIQLWERESTLNTSVLVLDLDHHHDHDGAREGAIACFLDSMTSPLIVLNRDRSAPRQRLTITFNVQKPTPAEQLTLWHYVLPSLNGFAESLTSQFNLNASTIESVSVQATSLCDKLSSLSENNTDDPSSNRNNVLSSQHAMNHQLWHLCRSQARPQLDDLAQRIEAGETWEDLVLPEAQCTTLHNVVAHVRQRALVYNTWGFAQKGQRGLGISALFSGMSGTGKTMAAGVLAQELNLDLYRIDLSSVVSKYIGETEKNLRRVFDAAESGGVILLFDEADSLFGKRSDVKDSHDRYANMEVSYLLQRMESYRGLAILTSNLPDSIDVAFMRRIRFIVRFPFPEYSDRIQIWQHIFPDLTPTDGLNLKKLAKLNIAGGNIRNIALNAAFLAAENRQPVMMSHLLRSAQSEYAKLGRQLTDSEVKGWID
ncbi:ATP-binding protein [Leptolyngbya sp. CCY15150]|uniref:ATP-binding protein n=1 Tax=Leptolyngbya sp. CCY15150 TaxID=2767772 RepID=UPI00195117F9|nr:ATP-binding protein [Leptolyngbya sp. CCY15150]